jgi:hypothetical protein
MRHDTVQGTKTETGYFHAGYADSLSEFGSPHPLVASGGWILERGIPGTDSRDAMGCYPIFSCRDWSLIGDDLDQIGNRLVSLVLVADPFGNHSKDLLCRTFKDLVIPFKEHFITDVQQSPASFVSKHHQYYARKALEEVNVERCNDPARMLNEWSTLYDALVRRHQLSGIKAFSRAAFGKQLNVPGIVMLRATHEGESVAAHLWYVQNDVAFSHLAASSDHGYKAMAAYALSWWALEYFADKVRWIDWGAGAGLNPKAIDGLSRFKRGWSNDTRMAFLCGQILDRSRYQEIARIKGHAGSCYFPAYREDEFR